VTEEGRVERRQLFIGAGTGMAAYALAQVVVPARTSAQPTTADDALVYVSGNGNDDNDGRSPATALRTPQRAYALLPAAGGTIIAAPGRYDVLGGLALNKNKPVWIVGNVRPRKYIPSWSRAPYPGGPAAVLYSSTGAASLVTTSLPSGEIMGYGFRFSNLVFELTAPATKCALGMNSVNMGEVDGCIFWADINTMPAADEAVGVKVYTDNAHADASWWRIHDNVAAGMALCLLGNDTGSRYNCNQHVIRDNIGLGKNHALSTTRPFIRIVGGNRCVVRDNNVEAYNIGVQFQGCWMCVEDADGGEMVDVFVDLRGCNGCRIAPIGISTPTYALPSALLVRGDINTYGNLITAATAYNGAQTRTYKAASSSVPLANSDNIVVAPRL
jgi:hypothetical protein